MKELSKEYVYIKKMLANSGIDFKNISREDMLSTCENYGGKISNDNYITTLEVISDLYEQIDHQQCQRNAYEYMPSSKSNYHTTNKTTCNPLN